jgi:hypothetical protein
MMTKNVKFNVSINIVAMTAVQMSSLFFIACVEDSEIDYTEEGINLLDCSLDDSEESRLARQHNKQRHRPDIGERLRRTCSNKRHIHRRFKRHGHKKPCSSETIPETIPTQCDTNSKLRSKYIKGFNKGIALANHLWKKADGCEEFELFETELYENLNKIEITKMDDECHHTKQCRFAGMVDGIFNVLAEIENECFEICTSSGVLAGTLVAQTFCELMILNEGDITINDWVRGPIGICGLNFESMCDVTYLVEAQFYENENGVCYDYTIGDYESVFAAYGNEKCAFNNQDPDTF